MNIKIIWNIKNFFKKTTNSLEWIKICISTSILYKYRKKNRKIKRKKKI